MTLAEFTDTLPAAVATLGLKPTAVCEYETGMRFGSHRFMSAARHLKLDRTDANTVADTADHVTRGKRKRYDHTLRLDMLRACGLGADPS